MPSSQNSSDQQTNLSLTITAQALIIQDSTNQAMIKHADTNISQTLNTPTATPTPTSTLGVPMVSVSTTTNCRTGPGTDYDIVSSLGPGQMAEVVGKYSGGNYWVIKTPGGGGNCWLWGQYATITGNTDKLPEMIPPPAPPTSVPTAIPTLNIHVIKPIKPFILLMPTPTPTIIWKLKPVNQFYPYPSGRRPFLRQEIPAPLKDSA